MSESTITPKYSAPMKVATPLASAPMKLSSELKPRNPPEKNDAIDDILDAIEKDVR